MKTFYKYSKYLYAQSVKRKSVVTFGLDPSNVDYSKFPGLTKEGINQGVVDSLNKLKELGFDAENVYVKVKSAEDTVRKALKSKKYDCVLIGAGVRTTEFLLFEQLVNIAHELQPGGKDCVQH